MFDISSIEKVLSGKKLSFKDIARKLGIKRQDNKKLSQFIFSLIDQGIIFKTNDREYFMPEFIDEVSGVLRLNAKGFGFVDGESESYFIAPTSVGDAMNNDEVIIKTFNDPVQEGKKQGVVSEVTSRHRKTFVGRIVDIKGLKVIIPHDPSIKGKFKIEDDTKLEVGHEVKVAITKFSNPRTVKVEKILGFKDDVSMDIVAAIEDANIPYEFDHRTIEEAKKMPSSVSDSDIKDRTDLRNKLIVTIDGDDTKDFDDAVEVEKLSNGNFKLAVHIADVTHYVKEDKPLDKEAKIRGTSVYLADRVIPMLPTELSNGICSLNPNVDRLTITADMEINANGETVNYKIYPSVINSKHRLTYQEVNSFYRKKFSWDDKKLEDMLTNMLSLSEVIRKKKNKDGYIDFEISESKIVLDKNGKTEKIVPRERLESEMLIEDFMVRANEVVAEHVEKNKLAFIYRVHDKPDLDRVQNLQGVIKILGIDVTIPQNPVPSEFARSINQIKKTRFDDFMKVMMLRTMAKAIYSPTNIGHFGLASNHYTHFTSPIRRYPDLMVHRMLREYFFIGNKKSTNHFAEILPQIAEHSSTTEQKAMDLERKIDDLKKAEFYERFIGEQFEGTIVSMMKFGFFVEFPNKVDGLVHISSLPEGFKLSDNGYSLTNGKIKYMIGDKILVAVESVDKAQGKINLVLPNKSI